MAYKSKFATKEIDKLFEAILTLESVEECYKLFEDLCTIKDTSLVTVIALTDVLRGVKEIVSRDFTLSPFVVAGLFYLVFSYVIVKTFRLLEQKFDYLDNV